MKVSSLVFSFMYYSKGDRNLSSESYFDPDSNSIFPLNYRCIYGSTCRSILPNRSINLCSLNFILSISCLALAILSSMTFLWNMANSLEAVVSFMIVKNFLAYLISSLFIAGGSRTLKIRLISLARLCCQ